MRSRRISSCKKKRRGVLLQKKKGESLRISSCADAFEDPQEERGFFTTLRVALSVLFSGSCADAFEDPQENAPPPPPEKKKSADV
jgi:hypothetical protein